MSDHELLQSYTREQAEAAFGTLVARHLDLVYSAALRQVRSPHLAEEVTQSVFIELARRASGIPPSQPLAPWLYVVTRRTALNALRQESRRLARETVAAEIAAMKTPSPSWSRIADSLDEAMETLNDTERTAVVLRFFQNLPLREVGAALGVSEDTAQKRVSRALDRLRSTFLRRGIAITAAGLATDLSAHTLTTAPAALGASVTTAIAGIATQAALPAATTVLAMTVTKKILIATAVTAALTAVVYQVVTVRRQEVQIAQLKILSATWQREISRLDRQSAAAASRATQTPASPMMANTSEESTFDARLRALVENVNRLKKYLGQHPAEQIPEMRLLSDRAWFALAQKYSDLRTDADYRTALVSLRNSAKSEFLRATKRTLEEFLETSQGILPSVVAQLAPHFESPVESAIFDRYEMVATGRASALSKFAMILREKASLAIDPSRDNQAGLMGPGVAMGPFPNALAQSSSVFASEAQQKSVDLALRAFSGAHGGKEPAIDEIEKLLPYFQNPDDGTRFVQRFKDIQSRMMPAALGRALGEARRAYAITHHGAEATDQLELASYFQSPLDGARYLEFISRSPGLK